MPGHGCLGKALLVLLLLFWGKREVDMAAVHKSMCLPGAGKVSILLYLFCLSKDLNTVTKQPREIATQSFSAFKVPLQSRGF